MSGVRSTILRGTTALAIGAGLVLAGVAAAPAAMAATGGSGSATGGSGSAATAAGSAAVGRPYKGDPDKEARLVSAEDDRIYNVRALASAARWSGLAVSQPYRLATGRRTRSCSWRVAPRTRSTTSRSSRRPPS